MPYKDYQKQLEANRQSYARHREKRVQEKRNFRDANLDHTRKLKRESMRRIREGRPRPRLTQEIWDAYCLKRRVLDQNRRRHHLRSVEGHCSFIQLRARIDYYGGLCWLCGAPMQAIDHVKPLAKGGTEWPANLRPICTSCNSKKRDLWPFN